ncbi:hypothetical protein C8Q77DRAFT_745058 [Trametes polyzona]|nr:hypothetical protein C8Q77DRAFT_745058 [Trametes polyzona]
MTACSDAHRGRDHGSGENSTTHILLHRISWRLARALAMPNLVLISVKSRAHPPFLPPLVAFHCSSAASPVRCQNSQATSSPAPMCTHDRHTTRGTVEFADASRARRAVRRIRAGRGAVRPLSPPRIVRTCMRSPIAPDEDLAPPPVPGYQPYTRRKVPCARSPPAQIALRAYRKRSAASHSGAEAYPCVYAVQWP